MKLVPCNRRMAQWLAALVLLCSIRVDAAGSFTNMTLSLTPPRGWNSYDSFSWIISEEEFLHNADYVATNLLKYGYEYVVVDFLWYRKHEPGATAVTAGYDIIDEWGRPVVDPVRWPSSSGGKGFKPVADKVHAMGLKFGIHVMRGISTAAVNMNTPILGAKGSPEGAGGRNWTAKDIAVPGGECSWMKGCFTQVNTSTDGGRAFINSLYQQYAEWGVDLIKHDCVFGQVDISVDEITAVSKAIEQFGRPILYSLSPGVMATPALAKQVAHLSHMYRITSDDWDTWFDVFSHFSVARDFAAAGLIGASGPWGGKSWPDLDMLPIGWLTDPGAAYGPYRPTSLTKDEQLTQITLWAIAKSPLMFGGDLRNIDQWTLKLLTQPIVLELNAHSTNNRELSSSSVQSSLPEVRLVDCLEAKNTLWKFKKGQNNICWFRFAEARYTRGRQEAVLTGCLNWKQLNLESQDPGGKRGELWSSTGGEVCLKSNNGSLKEKRGNLFFSSCHDTASQVWQLTADGELVNEEIGLCADVMGSQESWKVWASRGSEGQSYVAFFNLGSRRRRMSVALERVFADPVSSEEILGGGSRYYLNQVAANFLLRVDQVFRQVMISCNWNYSVNLDDRLMRLHTTWTCVGVDVWNNKSLMIQDVEKLEASVASHGTVLFELRCKPGTKSSSWFGEVLWYLMVLSILSMVLAGIRCYLSGNKRACSPGRCSCSRDWFTYHRVLPTADEDDEIIIEGSSPIPIQKCMQEFPSAL